MNTAQLIHKLIERKNLQKTEARELMSALMDGAFSPVQMSAILTALRMKGETVEEIAGFISIMRKNMQHISAYKSTIDTCGTGGDKSGTFNISTTVALLAAACGNPVAKHGNRAASSKSGSADVLEKLGLNIFLKPEDAQDLLKKTDFVFLFAPIYHPSMKYVAPIRKELGFKTIFNVLGPFANPASVRRQIIGVPDIKIARQLAKVARTLRYKHLCIVTSHDGLDEISISAETDLFEIKEKKIHQTVLTPEMFGIKRSDKSLLTGRDTDENSTIIHSIFSGEKGPKRDIVLLNTAYALYISAHVKNVNEGLALAAKVIDNGQAKKKLHEIIKQSQTYEKYTG